jgi:hypothetical protein
MKHVAWLRHLFVHVGGDSAHEALGPQIPGLAVDLSPSRGLDVMTRGYELHDRPGADQKRSLDLLSRSCGQNPLLPVSPESLRSTKDLTGQVRRQKPRDEKSGIEVRTTACAPQKWG